ncbi:MAG: DUF370 domain-containing protein [Syntrophomonadaceae bacterium]|nr:DUF370 domain-containing protein [Syntrophomonadaceae bacterium]
MFLHLGSDNMITTDQIIAIINIDEIVNKSIQDIIDIGIVEKKVNQIVPKDKAKSLIITTDRIFLSPISSATLLKRAKQSHEGGNYDTSGKWI